MALIERERELGRLQAALARARSGRGGVAFVAGEAGVGKTALLTALTDAAPQGVPPVRVAVGRCDALATPRVLGPFADVAPQLGIALVPDRDRVLAALLHALGPGAAPTLLVVEDAHWADEATIELLGLLGRRAPALPLLLAVSYRDDEAAAGALLRQVVGDLVTAGATAWIGLQPLSAAGVATLAAGHRVPPQELHARTGGNPFYVTEVLAAPDAEVPPTVRLAVLARVARLGAGCRELLQTVAVVPGRAERALVDAVYGPDPEAVAACLDAGVLVETAGALAFRHEIARLAVRAETPERTRRGLHRRVLAALSTAQDVDPARPAHHAAAAGDRAALARWSVAACRAAAARTADREAVRHGEQALALADLLDDDTLADVRTVLARSLVVLSRPEEAAPLADLAAGHWRDAADARREADALTVRSSAALALGAPDGARELLHRAVALLETGAPGVELAGAYVRLASLHMLARERDEAVAWGERAIELATALEDPAVLGRALVETGIADVVDGRFEGLQRVRRAIDLGRRRDLPGVVALGLSQIGSGCGELRRHDLAVPALTEGVAFAREHAQESLLRYQLAWLARCHLDGGRWDAAQAAAREALGGRPSLIARFVALNTTGWLRARSGEDDVWPALDEAQAIARRIGHLQRLWPNAVARAEAGWLEGDLEPHVGALRDSHDLALRYRHGTALGETALWLHRAGAPVDLPDAAADPFAAWVRGDLATAAAGFAEQGCPYELAWVQVQQGDPATRRGAVGVLERLGAAPLLRRLLPGRTHATDAPAAGAPATGAPATGVAAGSPGRQHPGGLSARQVEVLRLVAAGFTNPQIAATLFISRKTAEHHVSHILTRLGLSTRAEAAAEAVRLGLLE